MFSLMLNSPTSTITQLAHEHRSFAEKKALPAHIVCQKDDDVWFLIRMAASQANEEYGEGGEVFFHQIV